MMISFIAIVLIKYMFLNVQFRIFFTVFGNFHRSRYACVCINDWIRHAETRTLDLIANCL